jgi:hypothetical protein
MICQSEFISDSNLTVLLKAIFCRIRNRVILSLRGTKQSQYSYFLVSLARIRNLYYPLLGKHPSGRLMERFFS